MVKNIDFGFGCPSNRSFNGNVKTFAATLLRSGHDLGCKHFKKLNKILLLNPRLVVLKTPCTTETCAQQSN